MGGGGGEALLYLPVSPWGGGGEWGLGLSI